MGNKPACHASDNRIHMECKTPELLDSGKPRMVSVAFTPLPEYLLSIVAGYLSNDNDDTLKYAFRGEQPITLCLSEDVNAKLGSLWYMGFLPPERQWKEQADVKVDKQFLINDYENCLRFLAPDMSNYCRVVVDVLVVNLSNARDFLSALESLQITLDALLGHLNNVKHVVILIAKHTSCCFSFEGLIKKWPGFRNFFDPQEALCQIVDDLLTCWKMNCTLTTHDLLAFYFNNKQQQASEKYLAKLVISLIHPANRDLFKKETPDKISDKIMCVDRVASAREFEKTDENRTRLCHAIHLDTSTLRNHEDRLPSGDLLEGAFCFRDNRFIERIVINFNLSRCSWILPRLDGPLTDITPLSALIELSLKSDNAALDLADLNTGYFLNLKHLSFIGKDLRGHLDSHRVPRLKTLIIDLEWYINRHNPGTSALIREHTQSLIGTGHWWQLLASKHPGGWSLATYDDPYSAPQEEEADESLLSSPYLPYLPIIRELMLFMDSMVTAAEWEIKLKDSLSLEATAGLQREGLLVWAPERVEKITMFGNQDENSMITFQSLSPGQTRILSSLRSYNTLVHLLGEALPRLQSVHVNGGQFSAFGLFSSLETLSLRNSEVSHSCQLHAPLLQSLSCCDMESAESLCVRLPLLSQLSFLQLKPLVRDPDLCLRFFMDEEEISGLSRFEHVDLDLGMTLSPIFEQLQERRVSHLKLNVESGSLPDCWSTTAWQWESLEICAHGLLFLIVEPLVNQGEVVLPQLPIVKTLKVEERGCRVLLDREMPKLTDLTVPLPRSLGPNLRCPALRYIRFTGILSDIVKKQWLDPATYSAFGAQPSWVYFDQDGETHRMA